MCDKRDTGGAFSIKLHRCSFILNAPPVSLLSHIFLLYYQVFLLIASIIFTFYRHVAIFLLNLRAPPISEPFPILLWHNPQAMSTVIFTILPYFLLFPPFSSFPRSPAVHGLTMPVIFTKRKPSRACLCKIIWCFFYVLA